MGKQAEKNMLPMQAGDVVATCADIDDLNNAVGFTPSTTLSEGIGKFVAWYQKYYRI
jgi:UDP-glucuronate 4-epimerase